jgi:hypothetical protein
MSFNVLLGCGAMLSTGLLAFCRFHLQNFFQNVVAIYRTTWGQNPEDNT